MEWNETPNQYSGFDIENNISVEIKRKMSDQPWITIPLEKINKKLSLTVSVAVLNGRKYLTMQREDTGEKFHFDINQHRMKMKQLKGLQKCTESTKKALMD
jgi:mRNA-degrading endonuclease toxin of MazEF toxin-antitoxin module